MIPLSPRRSRLVAAMLFGLAFSSFSYREIVLGDRAQAAPAPATSVLTPAAAAQQIKDELDASIDNDNITVVVRPLTAGKYLVLVSGQLGSQDAVDKLKADIKKLAADMEKAGVATKIPLKLDGLVPPEPPKDPRQVTANTIATRAQKLLVGYGITVQALPLDCGGNLGAGPAKKGTEPVDKGACPPTSEIKGNTDYYQLKLVGQLPSVEKVKTLFAADKSRWVSIVAALNESLKSPKDPGPTTHAVEVVSQANIDDLDIDPAKLIAQNFKPVTDATTVTVTPYLSLSQSDPATSKTKDSYNVALNGTLDTLADIRNTQRLAVAALDKANKDLSELATSPALLPWVKLTSLNPNRLPVVTSLNVRGLRLKDTDTTATWTLSHLGSTGFSDSTRGALSPVLATVTALNDVFSTEERPAVVAHAKSLTLHGSLSDIRRMKSLLAIADSSHPQVQLSFWSVQASGKKEQVNAVMQRMQADIARTAVSVQSLHQVLNRALILSLIANGAANDVFYCRFYAQMFSLQPWEARVELADMAASTFQHPTLGVYLDQTGNRPSPAQLQVRDYSNDECLVLLGLLADRDTTSSCLRFSLQCQRFEELRYLAIAAYNSRTTASGHQIRYQPLDPRYYLALAFDQFKAVPPGKPWDNAEFQKQLLDPKPVSVPIVLSGPRMTTLSNCVNDPSFAPALEQVIKFLANGINSELSLLSQDYDKPGTPPSQSKKPLPPQIRALIDQNSKPLFSRLCFVFTPYFAAQTNSDANEFLRALHNYYDLERALGINSTPQGRYLRLRNQDNAEFGPLLATSPKPLMRPKASDYYSTHYLTDANLFPISDDPESTAEALNDAPENLVKVSDKVDALLESVITALSADIEEMYLEPLRLRLEDGEGIPQAKDGIALGARTTLNVSDNQSASQIATMYSYYQNSAPAPFSAADLFPGGAAIGSSEVVTGDKPSTTTTTPVSQARTLAQMLAGATVPQQLLLNGLFASDIQPNFAQVAPGISVIATPSTSLSGSSADLQLQTSFGVPSAAPDDKSNPQVRQVARPSGITSDQVKTRIDIEGFRLFQVSSENIHTEIPQGNSGIPILDRLPIFGKMFQWPMPPKRTEHQSLLLVNAVIVPRSLNLANFYGALAARNHPDDPIPNGSQTNSPLEALYSKPLPTP